MAKRINRTSPLKVRATERRYRAVELRMAGHPLRVIAAELEMSIEGARAAIARALAEFDKQSEQTVAEYRRLHLERLDVMRKAIWKKVMLGRAGALDRALKIEESERKLLGLEAPRTINLSGSVGTAKVEGGLSDKAAEAIVDQILKPLGG